MRMKNQNDACLLIALLAVAGAAVAGAAAYVAREQVAALSARVSTLERTPHYQGTDVNGNEVWAAQVTEVPLPPR